MAKWSTLSGRFNEEELKVIENYEKMLNINDNELVRGGVAILLGFMGMAQFLIRPEFEPLQKYSQEMVKMMESTKMQKELEKRSGKWLDKYKEEQWKKFAEEMKKIQEELAVFDRTKKKVKDKQKNKPGRPPESEYKK